MMGMMGMMGVVVWCLLIGGCEERPRTTSPQGGDTPIQHKADVPAQGVAPTVSSKPLSIKIPAQTGSHSSPALRIAAAADLMHVLASLGVAFNQHLAEEASEGDGSGQATVPRVEVVPIFAASGSLVAQIVAGAPFDVFMSADETYPLALTDKGRGERASMVTYARGRLALWTATESGIDVVRLGAEALRDVRVQRIALANPMHAPYGRAAEQVVRSLNLYDVLAPKFVLGENVMQAAQFVQSGAAQLGFVGRSLAISDAMKVKGIYWTVPAELHLPLRQGAVVIVPHESLGGRDERVLARRWCEFLVSEEAQVIFSRFGFEAP